MKMINKNIALLLMALIITACGGGSSDPQTPPPDPDPVVTISALEVQAYESSNDFAKFVISRTGTSGAISINYEISGNTDITRGSTSSDDYSLVYSDGGTVGATIALEANQNSRVIEVRPVDDALNEVTEMLVLTLASGPDYKTGSENTASIQISDASNEAENAKVFIGIFEPQNGAATTASGSLSILLQGDNERAVLSYTFTGLTSQQTDQHIHLSPSGTVIKDIELSGPVSSYVWDLEPGGPFTTRQQLLDALFEGTLFLNIHTANFPHGEISASFIYQADVEPPISNELTPEAVDRDIIRFLTQATFGPTPEAYQSLREQISVNGDNRLQVYNVWIESEFAKPTTSMLALTDASINYFSSEDGYKERRDAFWPMAVYGKDQLRQRITFALSEILVIGDQVTTIRKAHRGTAHYWDTLAKNAFLSYREALGDASRHPIMGIWLSHLRNQKEDSEAGYFPDENYAREIMQLFSFGLVQLQKNGAIKLGNDNLPMATYDNNVIQQMARVFTGLAMSAKSSDGISVPNSNFDLGNFANGYQYRWIEPMKFFPDHHEFGEKTLFTDNGETVVIPASTDTSIEAADAELMFVLDKIVSHSSTAPHISRILIQRLVTSNPSAQYIERVANAFGSTGDMKSLIKAILLDSEARNPSVVTSQTAGKMKESLLQYTSLMRLLEGGSQAALGSAAGGLNLDIADQYDSGASIMRVGPVYIGQYALGSDSVFNFFLPGFSPTGLLATNSLVAPELQLLTESQLFANINYFYVFLEGGVVRRKVEENVAQTAAQLTVTVKYDRLENIWDATDGDTTVKATAVVDYLDTYLNAGQLKVMDNSTTREVLIETIAAANANERYQLLVYGALISPEFMIQK